MKNPLKFIRSIFMSLSIIFFIAYSFTIFPNNPQLLNIILGVAAGIIFSSLFVIGESLLDKIGLKTFNSIALGAFFGVLIGKAALLLSENLIYFLVGNNINEMLFGFIEIGVFMACAYLGIIITLKNNNTIAFSIPFVRFNENQLANHGNFVIAHSALSDPRVIELASSGILGKQIIIPKFIIKIMKEQSENTDETLKLKSKKILDYIKKLEAIPNISIYYHEKDFPELQDINSKQMQLAKILKSNLLVADSTHIYETESTGITIININAITNALKPAMSAGEMLKIKIQRYGKESNQGIGYLENGTMVVVNGGGDYLGETIDTRVLSVKHTPSGRMIFCNVNDGELSDHQSQDNYQHLTQNEENYNSQNVEQITTH